jgi:hypothetical protein
MTQKKSCDFPISLSFLQFPERKMEKSKKIDFQKKMRGVREHFAVRGRQNGTRI